MMRARYVCVALLVALISLVGGAVFAALHVGHGGRESHVLGALETFVPPASPLGTPIDEQVVTVAFSGDGKTLVTGGGRAGLPGQLKIWDVARRTQLAGVTGISGVQAVACSPDGEFLVTGDCGGALRWRDPNDARELAAREAHAGGVDGVVFSHDGTTLASIGADGTVKLWDARTRSPRLVLAGHADRAVCVAFFRHGARVVSGSRDGTARVWDLRCGAEMLTLRHDSHVAGVAVAPDDRLVATASREGIRLWDASTGSALAALDEQGPGYLAVAFGPDGRLLAGAAADGSVTLWDVGTGALLRTRRKHRGPVWTLAFSPDGTRLASGAADRTAKVWQLGTGTSDATFETSWSATRPIVALAYAPDGAVLGVASRDGSLHLRDTHSGDVVTVMAGHAAAASCLAFAPDGATLASGSQDSTIKIWQRASGRETGHFHGGGTAVHALAFERDSATLISGGSDGRIRFWDAGTGTLRSASEAHHQAVLALAVAPDARQLASGSADGTIKLWDLAQQREIAALRGHEGPVRALVFCGDGALASAGADAVVRVWEPDGKARHTLKGHTHAVAALAALPGNRAIVSGAEDGTLMVWDARSGAAVGVLHGHKAAVTALALHPLGGQLVSGSEDTWLLRWRGDRIHGALLAQLADRTPVAQDAMDVREPAHAWSLRAPPEDRGRFSFIGREANECVRFEPEGLRITLPAGVPGEREFTGVKAAVALKGDFDIVVDFDVLQEPAQADAGKRATKMAVILEFSRAEKRVSGLARRVGAKNGTEFTTWGHGFQAFPTSAKKGRLRLVRQQGKLSFFVAEDADPFRLLTSLPAGEEDVEAVQLVASTGGEKAALDVRFRDLRIHAGLPAESPAAAAAEPRRSRWKVLVLALLGLALATGTWLQFRRRRHVAT